MAKKSNSIDLLTVIGVMSFFFGLFTMSGLIETNIIEWQPYMPIVGVIFFGLGAGLLLVVISRFAK